MNNTRINNLLEYFNLILILSYFGIHNIFLVIIGIIFSLYLINRKFIISIIGSVNKKLFIKKVSIDFNKNDNTKKSDSIKLQPTKDSKLTLVETIEELGFIPSKDKSDHRDAA